MTPEQRSEYVLAVALLRGCEIVECGSSFTSDWFSVRGCGTWSGIHRTKAEAAESWLRYLGIHINERGEVADLSTKVEA